MEQRPGGKRPELDGIRGVAILLVIWHHWAYLTFHIRPGGVISHITDMSWSGVDLFFVLSGFLIGGTLIDNRESRSYYRSFYVRRACRIIPLYLASLALFYLTRTSGWLYDPTLPWYSLLTLTQNAWIVIQPAVAMWLLPTWSLAVEEQFYLTLPLVVRQLNTRLLPYAAVAVVIMVPCLRAAFFLLSPDAAGSCYVLMPCRADALALGVLAAWCERKRILIPRKILYAVLATSFAGLFALSLYSLDRSTPEMMIGGYSLLAFFYCSVLLIATQGGFPFLKSSILRRAGVLAYGLYLFHLPVIGLVRGSSVPPALPSLSRTMIALPVLLLIVSISWRFFEKPFVDWGHRIAPYDRQRWKESLQASQAESPAAAV